MRARRLFTLTAKEYGYSGKEIAAYLAKDPASVSGYLRGGDLRKEVELFIKILGNRGENVNSEVCITIKRHLLSISEV